MIMLNLDLRRAVKDIIDSNAENGIVKDTALEQDIYEYILLDVKTECLKIAKEYMAKEGIVMEVEI